jgi:hypothetical protein
MRRAPSLLLKAVLIVVGSILAGGVVAANSAASDAAKRPNNSFNLYIPAPPGASPVQLSTPGARVASSRAVIMDPYKVPLIQDAGSLTTGR